MSDNLGLRLTERMTKSERDQNHPDSEPRNAATLMLIDRSGPTQKVLLGRRHHGHKFMPGKFVFPAGCRLKLSPAFHPLNWKATSRLMSWPTTAPAPIEALEVRPPACALIIDSVTTRPVPVTGVLTPSLTVTLSVAPWPITLL